MIKVRENPGMVISVAAMTFSRLMINITRRFAYPFIPVIARQLGVDVLNIQNVLALSSGIGISSPLFGPLSERYGRKRVMLGALLLMAAASGFGALFPQFWIFAAVVLMYGMGKMLWDPAMQAYIGDSFPYNRRGLVIGTVELSWATALFVAAPLTGFLLDTFGLQMFFVVEGVLLLSAVGVVWWVLPSDVPARKSDSAADAKTPDWRVLWQSRQALAAISYSLLLVMANEIFLINYGSWMEVSFDLVLAALGAYTMVIGVAEISGEFIVIGISDRLGKRRLSVVGALVAGITYMVMPFLSFSLAAALIGLFVMFIAVETAIVSSLSMFTEVLPEARSIMMSTNIGAHSLGRLLGATLGGMLLANTHNFVLMGVVSGIIGLGAMVLMWRFIHESDA